MNPEHPRIFVVVPVYNHGETLRKVVAGILNIHEHVLVVDDGSDDQGIRNVEDMPIHVRVHKKNLGKGAALRTAAEEALSLGATHIVTIDADGQHDPDELPKFFAAVHKNPMAVHVGCRDFETADVPGISRFGRAFSNFWLRVQTGSKIMDSQSGFRAYPLTIFKDLAFTDSRYSFEVEVLVRSAWAGLELCDIPISVYYPPREKRVSHFRAFADNVRISWLNTRLTLRSILPWPHQKITRHGDELDAVSIVRPLKSLKILLQKEATARGLAAAVFIGVFFGTLPLIGLRTLVILFIAGYFAQNRIAALAASQLCIPPFVPAICIEVGHYLRHGSFLTEISMQTLGYEALERIWEWIIGSLIVAPVLASLAAGATYWAAWMMRNRINP